MKRDVWTVPLTVTVPADTDKAIVEGMLNEMIGEVRSVCDRYMDDGTTDNDANIADAVHRILHSDFDVGSAEYDYSKPDCTVNADEALYIGDPDDGVYYQAFEDSAGKFWVSAIVDSDIVEYLIDSDGPYELKAVAEHVGRIAGEEWCDFNDVDWRGNHGD